MSRKLGVTIGSFVAVTALILMCGSAFAQNSGAPANSQNDMSKPGTVEKGTMVNGMNNNMGTSGRSQDKGSPKKEMSKDGSPSAGSKDMMKK